MSRAAPQPELDARARRALLSYLAAAGVSDPVAILPRALGGDPDKRLKRQRILHRGLLLLTHEARMDAGRARLYVRWAELGWPDPPPADLRPLTDREREHALREWRAWLEWLRQLGIEPLEVDRRPLARAQRERKELRRQAEAAVQRHETYGERAAAQRALAALAATDPDVDEDRLRRLEWRAEYFERRSAQQSDGA